METSAGYNHMGVAVFHGSVRGRRGDSAGRRCCFMGHRSSPTWTAVGKRAFEVRPASPRGVEIGYCCTFSTAEQGECLERSMGTLSVCQTWSRTSNAGPWKGKGEGSGGLCLHCEREEPRSRMWKRTEGHGLKEKESVHMFRDSESRTSLQTVELLQEH